MDADDSNDDADTDDALLIEADANRDAVD